MLNDGMQIAKMEHYFNNANNIAAIPCLYNVHQFITFSCADRPFNTHRILFNLKEVKH